LEANSTLDANPIPMPPFRSPSLSSSAPGGPPVPGAISPRKLILAIILLASILFFFLILAAATVAVLHEAAPHGHMTGHTLVAIRHVIERHFQHYAGGHHK
jgi:hypothetical protein